MSGPNDESNCPNKENSYHNLDKSNSLQSNFHVRFEQFYCRYFEDYPARIRYHAHHEMDNFEALANYDNQTRARISTKTNKQIRE